MQNTRTAVGASETRARHSGLPGLGGGRVILRPTLPYLAVVPGAVIGVMLGVVPRPTLAAIAVSAALCALVRATIESVRIELLRERADGWIVAHAVGQPTDDTVRRRTRELTDPRTRASLAASIRLVADESERRPHRGELRHLARELGDLSRPVTPRGAALAHRLLVAAGGPLHDPRRATELSAAVRDTIAALHAVESRGRTETR